VPDAPKPTGDDIDSGLREGDGSMYPKSLHQFIGGEWIEATGGRLQDVVNPATNLAIAQLGQASSAELDRALNAAEKGFAVWRRVSPYERSKILRQAADLIRARADEIARLMTLEQGKILREAKAELSAAVDVLEWHAEEGRRAYGRVVPSRASGVRSEVVMEPVGPVAAFSPWNFPVNQAMRKIAPALAAGCSIIIKCPEETPASPSSVVKCFQDAGLPSGVLNLVFGVPSEVSQYLIPSQVIRKVSFTGSVSVGKHLAALAGMHMKRATMELGGHSPVLVFDDVDVEAVAALLVGGKFRNAGQVCIAPTRIYVHRKVHDRFVDRFVSLADSIQVGDGLEPKSEMGPLANQRRVAAMESMLDDVVEKGAKIAAGGKRIGNQGNFFQPTVVLSPPRDSRLMREEPFGPVALIIPFDDADQALSAANSLPFGLASYAFTHDSRISAKVANALDHGMVSINHFGLQACETPFGGVKDSGYGHEGGIEGLNAYMSVKFVSRLN
jgi:succinate-semialdehyde dehydrogenase / glutarate-semialdehyde dehydrogenase